MDIRDFFKIGVFLIALLLLVKPLGSYIYKVLEGELSRGILGKLENFIYRFVGISAGDGMDWKRYLIALLVFNAIGFVFLFVILVAQGWLPLNPRGLPGLNPVLAFNAAISFVTNTNWQSYAGETTLSYFSQAVGLTTQNFLSAATGIAVFIALTRGLINKEASSLGNFWVDATRSILYVLLPLSVILSVLLGMQGVIQNISDYVNIKTIEGFTQTLPMGPAASQTAIKMLGTNGGGFFNANSAFPFENPTPFSNLLEMLAMLAIPAALTYTYGRKIGSTKQGWVIFSVMMVLFVIGLSTILYVEHGNNPVYGISGNIEGKETRFGISNSAIFANSTTSASCGAVNSMHESYMPLSGMVQTINMMLGEIIFGGVGAGMYGMLNFVLLTLFITGLMIGRTPEYLGKKIQAREVQMSMLAIIAPNFVILAFSALSAALPQGISSLWETSAHGLSEIIYAFSSGAGNNGSAFAGLNANTDYYNILIGIAMIIGRFAIIAPIIAIAGSMSTKKAAPYSVGSFKTDSSMFGFTLLAVILFVGGLTFFPALAISSIAQHLM
jgi:potassium-transporting ATPase potassium-binding subunit